MPNKRNATKKLRQYRAILIYVAVLGSAHSLSSSQVIVNVGFRLGFVTGIESGFIAGMELSITALTGGTPYAAGIYFSIENRPNLELTHFGVEAFPTYWTGISVGMSEIVTDEVQDSGYHASMFGGMFVLPYYQITVPKRLPILHGFGAFGKLPIPIGFKDFSVG